MNRDDPSLSESLGGGESDGSVFVFLDESFAPFVAAGAVVVESSDVRRLDSDIEATYNRVKGWYHLAGMPSFDEFRQRGFHAASDPLEVRLAFVAFLAEALNFKSMIVYSDRSRRADLSDKKRLMIVIDQLVRDLLSAYRTRPKITFYFESAQAMDPYIERLVARVVRSLNRKVPDVEVRFGTKMQPHLLAVPDYALHVFNRWISSQEDGEMNLKAEDHESRSFKAILGSISMARSLDDGRVIRRTLDDRSSV